MHSQFDEDYFLRGKESRKSLYRDYRWLPELTLPMCNTIAAHLGALPSDTILDFGCARGYVVRAFRELGFNASGIDISEWAVQNCDPAVKEHVSINSRALVQRDWTIAKDVLEHLSHSDLREALFDFEKYSRKGVFIVVPLASWQGGLYEIAEYEADITHQVRWTLEQWAQECIGVFGHKWDVAARFRIQGIKDNYAYSLKGNGFLTIKRIAQ